MARHDLVVPKFGNWDDGGNVQYTEYFERAREAKSDFEAVRPDARSRGGRYLPKEVDRSACNRRGLNPRMSGGCARKSMRSPLRPCAVGVLATTGTSQQHTLHDGPRLRHHRGVVAGKASPPLWQRRHCSSDVSNYNNMAPQAPERLRVNPVVRGEESPNHGNSVPKFGDWDLGNPSAGENYTEIFNRVIDQKQIGTEIVPTKTVKNLPSSHSNSHDIRSFRGKEEWHSIRSLHKFHRIKVYCLYRKKPFFSDTELKITIVLGKPRNQGC